MLQSYLNDKSLKISTIKAMKSDIKAERLVKGHYWRGDGKDGNGCFVGCVIRGNDHSKFETMLGIPRILARLGDRIFEGLDFADAKKFTIDFLEAIPVGVNLTGVWDKFAHFMLVDAEYGVIKFAKTDRSKKAIQDVSDVYARKIGGEIIDVNEWLKVRKNAYAADAAYAAYADAAAAYAAAYAADAAYAAADAAAYAAADAADAAAAYAAAAAAAAAYAADAALARSRHYAALATRLLELFREASN